MNIRKASAAVLLAAGLAVIPLAAQRSEAGKGFGGHHRGGAHMLGFFAKSLDLTDAQKATAKQLFADARTQSEPIAAQLKANRTDIETAVKANNTAAISQLSARQGVLMGQISEIRTKAMATFYTQLTPEQKTKAEELKAKFEQRRQKWQNRPGAGAAQGQM